MATEYSVVGDETGLVKLVDFSSKAVWTVGTQSRATAVEGMCWLVGGGAERRLTGFQFATLHKSSTLSTWRLDGAYVGAGKPPGSLSLQTSELVTGVVDPVGVVAVQQTPDVSSGGDFKSTLLCYGGGGRVSLISVSGSASRGVSSAGLEVISGFDVQGPVSNCVTCLGGGAAFGGRDNDVKLYDLNTEKVVWEAKNVPHDSLRMRVPIWISKMAMMRPAIDSLGGGCHLLTGTGHKHVRLYDTHVKRQPVLSINIGEYRVTSISPRTGGGGGGGSGSGGEDYQVYVGDTSGGIHLWDIRANKRIGTLKGCTGSVRDMSSSSSGKSLVCTGLDRYVRKFDTSSNKSTGAVYLKNRVNCCLLVDDGNSSGASRGKKRSGARGGGGGGGDDDDDDDYSSSSAAGDSFDDDDDEDQDDRVQEEDFSEDSGDEDEEEQAAGTAGPRGTKKHRTI